MYHSNNSFMSTFIEIKFPVLCYKNSLFTLIPSEMLSINEFAFPFIVYFIYVYTFRGIKYLFNVTDIAKMTFYILTNVNPKHDYLLYRI